MLRAALNSASKLSAATFHPAYLLRSPSYKRMSWQDLRAIAKALEQANS